MTKIHIYKYDDVSSTNDKARELALEKPDEEFSVIARRQEKGKGRRGNVWESPEGGLYLSILIKPDCPADKINRLYIISGYTVARVLKEITNADIKIKWPNDIIYNDKKLGGILIETSVVNERLEYAVVGIGLNISSRKGQLPDNAVNVADITSNAVSINDIAIKIISELRRDRRYLEEDFEELINKWQKFCDIIGKEVKITYKDREIKGKVKGLDKKSGALVVGREVVGDLGYLEMKINP